MTKVCQNGSHRNTGLSETITKLRDNGTNVALMQGSRERFPKEIFPGNISNFRKELERTFRFLLERERMERFQNFLERTFETFRP